jgi:phospholipase C
VADGVVDGTVIGDPDPAFDDCSGGATAALAGPNVGDLLNAKGVSWGWFSGGFRPTGTVNGQARCDAASQNLGGASVKDYIPHHEPFQYYPSTANPHHLPPSAVEQIGLSDQANHQYDLEDFWAAAQAGRLPAVSYLKARAFQDGHPGYSDPLDEQAFLVDTLNRLQDLPAWPSTAVVIAYDDSDGWYDHVMPPILSHSQTPADALTGPGACGAATSGADPGRCGFGPRLPLLVVSPFARVNAVDHTLTDQTSILRFVEDNWQLGRIGGQSFDARAGTLSNLLDFERAPQAERLFLDPATGEPTPGRPPGPPTR